MMKKLFATLVLLTLLPAATPYQSNQYPVTAGQVRVIGYLTGADFNKTADQAIPIDPRVSKYIITAIYVTDCSGALNIAAGGVYTAPSKGGNSFGVAGSMFGGPVPAVGTISLATPQTASTVFLTLSTAAGQSVTCNVWIVGVDLAAF